MSAPCVHSLLSKRSRLRHAVLGTLSLVFLILAFSATPASAVTQTFFYTGAQQTFTVPVGVASVGIVAIGGSGGKANAGGGGVGGTGAAASGDLSVVPGETLYVEVGGNGHDGSATTVGLGGFNGGGNAGDQGGGGGGASDVRLQSRPAGDSVFSLNSRMIVAAGGGGGGAGNGGASGGNGGAGGSDGTTGSGGATGGSAGSLTGGGFGCGGVCDGSLGTGGNGTVGSAGSGGGGGGAGYYGGGGGQTNVTNAGGGGGGGSSLIPPGGSTVVPSTPLPPQVQISYTPPTVEAPSNEFKVLTSVVAKNNSIALLLNAPSAGAFKAVAKGKRSKTRHFSYGTASAAAAAPGGVALVIHPSRAAKKALKTSKRVSVSIAITFTPTGGVPKTRILRLGVTANGMRAHR